MLTSRSKNKTEWLRPSEFKDYKDSWPEIETLGHRLDCARRAVKRAKEGTWAHTQWTIVEANLFKKWKLMVALHQCGLRQQGPNTANKINIDYSWWEGSEEVGINIPVIDNIGRWVNDKFGFADRSLDRAWEMARNEFIQKARQGLV